MMCHSKLFTRDIYIFFLFQNVCFGEIDKVAFNIDFKDFGVRFYNCP